MMPRVKDTPPEYPDSLPSHVEERHLRQPERLVSSGQGSQSSAGEGHCPLDVGLDRRSITVRKERLYGWFRKAQELGEEAPLRQNLMSQNFTDRAAAWVGPELELIISELTPD
jgi:hypothetical protein